MINFFSASPNSMRNRGTNCNFVNYLQKILNADLKRLTVTNSIPCFGFAVPY